MERRWWQACVCAQAVSRAFWSPYLKIDFFFGESLHLLRLLQAQGHEGISCVLTRVQAAFLGGYTLPPLRASRPPLHGALC